MTPEYKAKQIASEYHFLENEPKTDEAMQARIIDGALQMYRWAQTAIDDLELENRKLNARMIEMANEFMRNNNMQSEKKKKKSGDCFWDITEKVCEIVYAIIIWGIIIAFILIISFLLIKLL